MTSQDNRPNLYALAIPKEHVLTSNFTMLHTIVKKVKDEPNAGYDSMLISFDDYNDTPDEIYEITEIRAWVKRAFKSYPHLLYFITNMEQNRGMLIACVSDISFDSSKRMSINQMIAEGVDITNRPQIGVSITHNKFTDNIINKSIRYGVSKGYSNKSDEFIDWYRSVFSH